jgi:hypothetical protein
MPRGSEKGKSPKLGWILLALGLLIPLGLLLAQVIPLTTTAPAPSGQKVVTCINEDQPTCKVLIDALTPMSGGIIQVIYFSACTPEVVLAAVHTDLVFVDGVMRSSPLQGPECVAALVTAKGGLANPPPIIAYSTDSQISAKMVSRGADADILPTAGINNIYALVARLLGLAAP